MTEPLVSIVINNFNYARFLPEAIESALGQDYPRCEVIVVDDGSQDGSVEVIAAYGDHIQPLRKSNGGQSSALNAGFAASQGDMVIFLDSDDRLEPQAACRVAEVFIRQPEMARVQFRMAVIDAAGERTGAIKPAGHVPAPSGDIRRQVLHFPFDLAWLPTSGNAFSARVLRQVMPIPGEYGRIYADYYLVHTTPLFGPVAFLDQVLACYRVHGGNNFERTGASLDLDRLRSTIHYDELTYQWIRRRAREAGLAQRFEIPAQNGSVSSAASRLASLKLEPEAHPLPGDRIGPLVALGMRSALGRFDTSPAARRVFWAWFICTGLAPRSLARWLADLFFFPERRQAFTRLLGRLHNRRSSTIQPPPAGEQEPSSGRIRPARGEEG